jgi:hypothetical protein
VRAAYTLVVTSYLSSAKAPLAVKGTPFSVTNYRIPLGQSGLIKVEMSNDTLAVGTDRFRATLFKDGVPIAASNVVTVHCRRE